MSISWNELSTDIRSRLTESRDRAAAKADDSDPGVARRAARRLTDADAKLALLDQILSGAEADPGIPSTTSHDWDVQNAIIALEDMRANRAGEPDGTGRNTTI